MRRAVDVKSAAQAVVRLLVDQGPLFHRQRPTYPARLPWQTSKKPAKFWASSFSRKFATTFILLLHVAVFGTRENVFKKLHSLIKTLEYNKNKTDREDK